MKRAEQQALRSIAQLHRELAAAYERLAEAGAEQSAPTKVPPPPAVRPSEQAMDTTRRALRRKGIAA